MKQVLIYSLKVWLTSVLISPIIFILIEITFKTRSFIDVNSVLGFIAYSIPYGLVLSIPSWLLFFACIYNISKFIRNLLTIRLIVTLVGSVLSLLSFYIIFHRDDDTTGVIPWALSYCIIIIAGSWFYAFNANVTESKSIDHDSR